MTLCATTVFLSSQTMCERACVQHALPCAFPLVSLRHARCSYSCVRGNHYHILADYLHLLRKLIRWRLGWIGRFIFVWFWWWVYIISREERACRRTISMSVISIPSTVLRDSHYFPASFIPIPIPHILTL